MNQSKILMLGGPGSGKTCYMLGMFAEMSLHVNHFTLVAAKQDDGVRLRNAWRTLEDGEGQSRWPAGNMGKGMSYGFKLCYDLNPFHSFEWLDYRGGALNLPETEPEQAEYRNFFLSSTCAFLCVKGAYLKEELAGRGLGKVAQRANIDIMLQDLAYLKEARGICAEKPFPVVIVLTQYDLCRHRGGEALGRDLRKLFELLFQPGSGWYVAICPVSLGLNLVNNLDKGEIEPVNMHLPVIFAVYAAIRSQLQGLRDQERQLTEAKVREDSRLAVARFLFGDNRQEIEIDLAAKGSEIAARTRNLMALSNELADLDIYLSGKAEDFSSSADYMRHAMGA